LLAVTNDCILIWPSLANYFGHTEVVEIAVVESAVGVVLVAENDKYL